ncbi:MAG TPA: SDR family NAD(P)-dependent oxidoreductase [Dehalococcoidia bacterium]|nr:SDR family NAD(P)-dependent oxidoreductase [Dehalococcoidia bacterium]
MTPLDDLLDMSGKVVLVTGAARGIGQGIANVFAAAGAKVVLADIDEEAVKSASEGINGEGIVLDVSEPDAVDAAITGIVSRHGSIDVVVNNAGIYNGFGGPIVDMSTDVWRKLMSVNLDGTFYCSRAACRAMIEAGNGGKIINLASTQGFVPGVGVSYDSSKAAVIQFTRVLALEMAKHNIRVNAVAPGATWVVPGMDAPPISADPAPPVTGEPLADTVADRIRRIPLQRWGTPDEMGHAALFLASDMSTYITGVTLPVEGGWLAL